MRRNQTLASSAACSRSGGETGLTSDCGGAGFSAGQMEVMKEVASHRDLNLTRFDRPLFDGASARSSLEVMNPVRSRRDLTLTRFEKAKTND